MFLLASYTGMVFVVLLITVTTAFSLSWLLR